MLVAALLEYLPTVRGSGILMLLESFGERRVYLCRLSNLSHDMAAVILLTSPTCTEGWRIIDYDES